MMRKHHVQGIRGENNIKDAALRAADLIFKPKPLMLGIFPRGAPQPEMMDPGRKRLHASYAGVGEFRAGMSD